MQKFNRAVVFFFLFQGVLSGAAQNKYEQEFRIRKSQFPKKAYILLENDLQDVRKLKFYKEIDSAKTSYEAKFKKARLHYSVEFSENGDLEDIEIRIKEVDVPKESLLAIKQYLSKQFGKFRIRKIQQQYPHNPEDEVARTLKNAFQNLLIPSLHYELIVAAKTAQGYQDYELLFDAEGGFKKLRKSLPANYDHVLY